MRSAAETAALLTHDDRRGLDLFSLRPSRLCGLSVATRMPRPPHRVGCSTSDTLAAKTRLPFFPSEIRAKASDHADWAQSFKPQRRDRRREEKDFRICGQIESIPRLQSRPLWLSSLYCNSQNRSQAAKNLPTSAPQLTQLTHLTGSVAALPRSSHLPTAPFLTRFSLRLSRLCGLSVATRMPRPPH